MSNKFADSLRNQPFADYNEYMRYLFACVNDAMDKYLEEMKTVFASDQGGYKNVLYPDLAIAHDVCKEHVAAFFDEGEEGESDGDNQEDLLEDVPDDLMDLLGAFSTDNSSETEKAKPKKEDFMSPCNRIDFINERAKITLENGIELPFYELCIKEGYANFTIFCLTSAILSSTQTDYASIFQVINENGNLSSPTIESAARLYFGKDYSITGAYGELSVCLEQLQPVLPLHVVTSMPFSTSVSPDKRIIDYLFGKDKYKLDATYSRYFSLLTRRGEELPPVLSNQNVLDAMEISFKEGTRIFSYVGDEGSGRKFFVKCFCKHNNLMAITLNCKKLFSSDLGFVDSALWALTRECILTGACACLEDLSYREEEKEHFQTCMDMAFQKLVSHDVVVFTMSKDDVKLSEITKQDITSLALGTPNNIERLDCWKYYGQFYELGDDVDLEEMTVKFLFTPGKIKDALRYAKNLSLMDKSEVVMRSHLFKGCNAQMSSELSQKATRVEAKFGFEDIVMNDDQRETITHAIEQMNFRRQVYDEWNYTKKYPYGRGLTVLLFGAPGTGKSMMAQVIAHELNLELYRVDISKVVDKYVGETEKSLSMIFREAKKCNVVLFFDECDTIFAKRSDDGGSNQASANNKTALLLQEMEAYDGVCVLATNYKHNIDPAFFRRMKYIVEFQFPNADTREMLWRTTVPKTTPLDEDVDFRFIAEHFEFAGGNIKNCILNAAFLAAADETANGKVCMRHYLRAIKYEFVKVGKVFTRADFEPYAVDVFGF